MHNGLQDSRRVCLLIEILDDLVCLPPTCGGMGAAPMPGRSANTRSIAARAMALSGDVHSLPSLICVSGPAYSSARLVRRLLHAEVVVNQVQPNKIGPNTPISHGASLILRYAVPSGIGSVSCGSSWRRPDTRLTRSRRISWSQDACIRRWRAYSDAARRALPPVADRRYLIYVACPRDGNAMSTEP